MLLQVGSEIIYGGQRWRVGAVLLTGGERYYHLVRDSEIAMLPAFVVEPHCALLGQRKEVMPNEKADG